MGRLAFVAAITLVSAGSAGAHVQPSVDDNNRYIKLTPLGDRVRIAYTILYGEIPGARERATIDTDHDGTISDAEAQAFANKLAADIAAALDLDVDGAPRPLKWDETTMSVGTPAVAAGTFAVDLVAYPCLPSVRGKHRIVLRDRFRLPNPGEVEVMVEDAPGVTIERAHVGAQHGNDVIMVGPGGPLAEDGFELAFDAGERAPVAGGCAVAAPPTSGSHVWIFALAGGALVCAVGALVGVVARRRRAKRHIFEKPAG